MSIKSITGRTIRLTASPKTVDDFKRGIDVGEILRGRIVELFKDNKALVFFKGFNLMAETEIAFKKGDIFFAQVRAKEPKIVVKILPLDTEHPHGFTDQDALEIIRHLGKRETDELIRIIKELIRHRVPIRGEIVEEIQRHLSHLDGDIEENIRTLIFMRLNGIRITPRSVELIKSHLFGGLDIAKTLEAFLDAMQDVKVEGKEEVLGLVRGLFIRMEGELGEQIRTFLDRVGFGYESALFGMLQGGDGRGFNEQRFRGKNLKFELLKLLAILKRMEGVDSLREVAKRLLRDIFAMQLVSTSRGEESYLYIQLPIQLGDGRMGIAELKIYYEKEGRGHFNPNDLTFRIILNTTNLGAVEVDVRLYDGVVDITFRMEDSLRSSFIASRSSSLSKGLEASGYKVGRLFSTIVSRRDEDTEEEMGVWNVGRVDFRV
jgi:hypothetical protein